MDRGRTFLAAGLALFLGCTLVGAEVKLLSTPGKTGQALMLQPVFDAVPHEVFSVRARGVERAGRAAPGRAGELRDAALRRAVDRAGRDAQGNGRGRGHLLTGPEMALAGVFVLWGIILIAGHLRRRAARPR
jgi:hypothetical protein